MKIQCDKCQSIYNVNEEKIPERGAKVKCKKCSNTFIVVPNIKQEIAALYTDKKCPKCEAKIQNNSVECNSCGLIFEKYNKVRDKNERKNNEINKHGSEADGIEPNTGEQIAAEIESNQKESLQIDRLTGFFQNHKIRKYFYYFVEVYKSLNVWEKLFFGFMLFVWFLLAVFRMVGFAREPWHLYHLFSIPTLIAYQGFVFVVFPYLILKTVQKYYKEGSVIYKFLSLKGRIQRLDYFLGTLVLESLVFFAVIIIPTLFLFTGMTSVYSNNYLSNLLIPLLILPLLLSVFAIIPVSFYSIIVITLKRISDIGKSRWLGLMFLVPFVNFLFQIALYFIPSFHTELFIDKSSKECPECAESVLFKAQICRFCGYRFETKSAFNPSVENVGA